MDGNSTTGQVNGFDDREGIYYTLQTCGLFLPTPRNCDRYSVALPSGPGMDQVRQCVSGLRDVYQPESFYHRWAERTYQLLVSGARVVPVNVCRGREEPPPEGPIDQPFRDLLTRFGLAPGLDDQRDVFEYFGGRIAAYADHTGSERLAVLLMDYHIGDVSHDFLPTLEHLYDDGVRVLGMEGWYFENGRANGQCDGFLDAFYTGALGVHYLPAPIAFTCLNEERRRNLFFFGLDRADLNRESKFILRAVSQTQAPRRQDLLHTSDDRRSVAAVWSFHQAMEREGARTGVLFYGNAHAERIMTELEGNRYSYIAVVPRVIASADFLDLQSSSPSQASPRQHLFNSIRGCAPSSRPPF